VKRYVKATLNSLNPDLNNLTHSYLYFVVLGVKLNEIVISLAPQNV